jgi:hypothetical protein
MSDKASQLQSLIRPSSLYKYRSGSEKDIDTLKKRKIWVPSFHDLNDIFENDFEFEEETALNNANVHYPFVLHNKLGEPILAPTMMSLSLEGEALKQHKEKIKLDIHHFREKIFNLGIYSLARHFNNQSMWGLYSNSHKGYCIKYKEFDDKINLSILGPKFVIYADVPPKIEWSLIQHYSQGAIMCNMIFHKPEDWKTEEEYRVIFEEGNKEYDIPYQIESIIFGERAENDLKDQIYEIFSNEVKYEKIEKVKGTFKLITVEDEYCKTKLRSLT